MSFHTPPLMLDLHFPNGNGVSINANSISSMVPDKHGHTLVAMNNGQHHEVTETIEQINTLIDEGHLE